MKYLAQILLTLLIAPLPLLAQTQAATEPRPATYCEISKDPSAYNHQLVRLTAFVTHGFEDFQIADPECRTQGFSIWLKYGGNAESNTVYCCPGEAGGEARSKPLTIEGVQIPLIDDPMFQKFRDLLKKEPDTTIKVTLAGRFFAEKKQTLNGMTFWKGAGHWVVAAF